MGYKKAEEILPKEMIELIQQYADGVNIYIPRKEENKQQWGSNTSYKEELQQRNRLIYGEYLKGTAVCELAEDYFLSVKSIQRNHHNNPYNRLCHNNSHISQNRCQEKSDQNLTD